MNLIQGDCLERLKDLKANSVDALVSDPPAGISFMGKSWDGDRGGRKQWVAWMIEVMTECLRVMKPGAHGLVWALPRTSHWTATALEDAGFEIRDVVTHLFGSGFPKSLDVSKAIDKAAGASRIAIGTNPNHRGESQMRNPYTKSLGQDGAITAPATPDAKQWAGWGTALKPASEHWILVRKPCSEKTVAANVLKWGTGAINVDASRVGYTSESDKASATPGGKCTSKTPKDGYAKASGIESERHEIERPELKGRFPANLILSHSDHCLDDQCSLECAVMEMDRQSGSSKSTANVRHNNPSVNIAMSGANLGHLSHGHADSGGASRFFKNFKNEPISATELRCASSTSARNAVKNSSITKAIEEVVSTSSALESAPLISGLASRYLTARSAVSSAGFTEMNSVLEAVKTLFKKDRRLLQCLDSMPDSKKCILRQDLAFIAEASENTGITQTIQSFLKLFGCVPLAIEESTKQESQRQDSGHSRFLYIPKASKREKNAGLEGMPKLKAGIGDDRPSGQSMQRLDGRPAREAENTHPTVKSTKLMTYLIRMITPPGGIVLDPFMGSGSTGVAAVAGGWKFTGIERDKDYFKIAKKRVFHSIPKAKKQVNA